MSKEISKREEIRKSLDALAPQFKMALPSHIPVEKFTRAINTAIANNPSILEADRTSLFAACMKSAEMGLFANGRDAALVPFGNKVNFMPMIAGVLKLIRNSGELSTIMAENVYENDDFTYYVDSDGPHLHHKPEMFSDRGKFKGVYALAKMKDGSVYIEVMGVDQINSVKKASRSPDKGPWSTFPEEMNKKACLRRLAKRLPLSTDVDEALRKDDDIFAPVPDETEKVVAAKTNPAQPALPQAESEQAPAAKKAAPSKLKEAIKAKDVTPKTQLVSEPHPSMEDSEEEPVDRPAIFANEEGNDLDRALGEEPI